MPVSLAGDLDGLDRLRTLVLRGDASGRQLQLGDVATIDEGSNSPKDQSVFFEGPSRRRRGRTHGRGLQHRRLDPTTADESGRVRGQLLPAELGIETLFSQKVYTDRRAAQPLCQPCDGDGLGDPRRLPDDGLARGGPDLHGAFRSRSGWCS